MKRFLISTGIFTLVWFKCNRGVLGLLEAVRLGPAAAWHWRGGGRLRNQENRAEPCSSPLHHCLLPPWCGMGTDTSTRWWSLVPTGGFLSKYRTRRVSLSVSKQEFGSVCDPLCYALNRLNMYVSYIIEKRCDLDGCTLFPSFVSTIK